MKRLFLLSIICVLLFSCKKNVSKVNISTTTITNSKSFNLKGRLENFYPKKVYLNKIIENTIYPIDSFSVIENNFNFNGIVDFPERYAITFENYSAVTIVILENVEFEIYINGNSINDPQINGSSLNNKLSEYKVESKKIFKKIDHLFPQFQKARLENDAEKLLKIEQKMKIIENEFIKFSYNFIVQNKNSFVAAMILRDQLKSSTIDTLLVKKTYQLLPSEVKNSPDAEITASFLNLH